MLYGEEFKLVRCGRNCNVHYTVHLPSRSPITFVLLFSVMCLNLKQNFYLFQSALRRVTKTSTTWHLQVLSDFGLTIVCFFPSVAPDWKRVSSIFYADGLHHHIPVGAQGLQNPCVHPPEDLCHLRHCQRQGQGLATLSPETPLRSVSLWCACTLRLHGVCTLLQWPCLEHALTRMITINEYFHLLNVALYASCWQVFLFNRGGLINLWIHRYLSYWLVNVMSSRFSRLLDFSDFLPVSFKTTSLTFQYKYISPRFILDSYY